MPRYDYRCQACGKVTEFIHSIKLDHVNKPCPGCGKRKLRRLISGGINLIFKGEGFWRSTNYINQKAKEEGVLHTDLRPPRPM
jgi:putative FmdB family regulatory protein